MSTLKSLAFFLLVFVSNLFLASCMGSLSKDMCALYGQCDSAENNEQFCAPDDVIPCSLSEGHILVYPFADNKDGIITNDFAGHASYCAGSCQGIDYGVSYGTPVYASISGTTTVVDGNADQDSAPGCDDSAGYGNYVKIRNGSWEVIYGHMANGGMEVSNGATVEAGELLGHTSNSGYTCGSSVNGSAYHLHFEVEYDDVEHDPYGDDLFIIDSDGSYRYPAEGDYPVLMAYNYPHKLDHVLR